MSAEERPAPAVGVFEALRFLCEIAAIVGLAFWGFTKWPFAWNLVIGIGAPVVAILLWALFRSPRAVFRVDAYGKAVVELLVMTCAAFAWWFAGQHIVALVFAVVAVVAGVVMGRREFS